MPRLLSILAVSLTLAFGAGATHALAAESSHADTAAPAKAGVRDRYTKYEYQVPMRDGTRLFTVVYAPKDASKPYPFLMTRTPYSAGVHAEGELHYGEDWYPPSLGPSKEFEDAGYIFVVQDVRGRYMSEGQWQEATPAANAHLKKGEGTESQDMYDTVDWLLKHVPNNNGKVGIYGISYPGFYAAASIIDSHPAIKAASPQAPVTDLFMGDDSYHGGAFMLAANFGFYAAFTVEQNPTPLPKKWAPFEYGTTDAYDFFLQKLTMQNILGSMSEKQRTLLVPTVDHDTYDEFWQTRNVAAHMKNVKAAVLTVGGWFDAEDPQGPFGIYNAVKKNNPGTFSGLVIGPWVHGGWARGEGKSLGYVNFDSATSQYFRSQLQFPFFEEHLKGVKPARPIAEVNAFETGSNVWRHYTAWPPVQARPRTLYFGSDGKLTWQQPASGAGFDEYVADPKHPVPYIGYPATDVPQEYMVSDQRFAAKRPDVLVYQSDVLDEDVTVAGPVKPKLFVSTTGTDADWVVKLVDVYPQDYPSAEEPHARGRDVAPPTLEMGGYEQLVRGNPLRGKFRHSFENPEPFTPGKVEEISYDIGNVNHTFRRGHRIMVQVQSSWFPLVDLNPQTFVSIPKAKPEDFRKATQRVYHAAGTPSGLEVLVMPQH
ncbi:MAG: CocE/NonD family hydrolase [Telluria sp.]